MIRRILAGAAIAAVAFGFSTSAASADVGPNPYNGGQALLSQFQIVDDALNNLANGSFNRSFRDIQLEVVRVSDIQEVDLNLLNNN